MCVASVLPRFVDEECWRFAPRGLKTVLSLFSNVTIVPEVHNMGGLCRFLNLSFHDFLKAEVAEAGYEPTMCPGINLLGRWLDAAHVTTNDQWRGNYSVLARK